MLGSHFTTPEGRKSRRTRARKTGGKGRVGEGRVPFLKAPIEGNGRLQRQAHHTKTFLIRHIADRIRHIADRGQSLAQMALSWTLRDARVTSALIGASQPSQIVENVKAAEKTAFAADEPAADEPAAIDAVLKG